MAGAAPAQPVPDVAATPATTTIPHVRASDPLAADVLRRAVLGSPTVAGLIAQLDQSDVIVNIVTGPLPDSLNGHTRVAVATRAFRYLRVTVRIPGATPRLIATLGHELRHAVEIAGMPEVRCDATLAAAYRRVGVPMARDGMFETDAAVAAGRTVARELAGRH